MGLDGLIESDGWVGAPVLPLLKHRLSLSEHRGTCCPTSLLHPPPPKPPHIHSVPDVLGQALRRPLHLLEDGGGHNGGRALLEDLLEAALRAVYGCSGGVVCMEMNVCWEGKGKEEKGVNVTSWSTGGVRG